MYRKLLLTFIGAFALNVLAAVAADFPPPPPQRSYLSPPPFILSARIPNPPPAFLGVPLPSVRDENITPYGLRFILGVLVSLFTLGAGALIRLIFSGVPPAPVALPAPTSRLAEDGSMGRHETNQSVAHQAAGTVIRFSAYVHAGLRNRCRLNFHNGTHDVGCDFNLATETQGTPDDGINAFITLTGGGWYQVEITGEMAAEAAPTFSILLENPNGASNYQGTLGSGIYFSGAKWQVQGSEGFLPAFTATNGATITSETPTIYVDPIGNRIWWLGIVMFLVFVCCAISMWFVDKEQKWPIWVGAIWVVGVPFYFLIEHLYFFRYWGFAAQYEQFKRVQDLAAKVWAAAIVVLAAFYLKQLPHAFGGD